jgi:hypothetical protein
VKKVYVMAVFIVLSATLCLADNIHEFSLTWNVPGVSNQISIQTSNAGEIISSFGGAYSNLVPIATCNASPCTFFTTDLRVSGITATNVMFDSVLYPTVYFSGALDIITNVHIRPSSGFPIFGLTEIVGDLTACSDPSCSDHLFSLDIDSFAKATFNESLNPGLKFHFDSSGQPVLTSADLFTTPEPSSIALLATGCTVLFAFARPSRKTSSFHGRSS